MTEPNAQPFDFDAFLKTLTHKPGVHRMIDAEGKVIYVGKAKASSQRNQLLPGAG